MRAAATAFNLELREKGGGFVVVARYDEQASSSNSGDSSQDGPESAASMTRGRASRKVREQTDRSFGRAPSPREYR